MAAKLTRLAHKIAIQLHLVAESCTICSSLSRRPVLKLLDTTSYTLTTINIRWEATQRIMAAKLNRLTHKIAIQLYVVTEMVLRYRNSLSVWRMLHFEYLGGISPVASNWYQRMTLTSFVIFLWERNLDTCMQNDIDWDISLYISWP
jgi:hypothetical protein